jgi:predicted phosphodiesterase
LARKAEPAQLKKLWLIPDCHHPYADMRAWYLMLEAAKEFRPDILVTLGDFADFYAVSDHSKNPNRVRQLEVEVDAVNARLDELDALGVQEKAFVEGNHEDRLNRFLSIRAPEVYNMMRVRDLFRLPERKWTYVPYRQHVQIGKLYLTHDTGRVGPRAHQQSMDDFQDSVVIGHTHRIGYAVVGNAKGKPHVGAMFGWLGSVEEVDYMHRIKALRDWSLGFGYGYLEPNGCVHLRPVPIVDYTCVVDGKHHRG